MEGAGVALTKLDDLLAITISRLDGICAGLRDSDPNAAKRARLFLHTSADKAGNWELMIMCSGISNGLQQALDELHRHQSLAEQTEKLQQEFQKALDELHRHQR